MEVSPCHAPAIPPRRLSESVTTPPTRTADSLTPATRRFSQSVTPPPRRTSHSVTPPPRNNSRNITPPPRRTSQSVTPPPRCYKRNTTPPPRRNTENTNPPPVPTRWDICTEHVGHSYTALCTTCVKLLCNKCLVSQIYYHQQCSVAYLSENVQQACHTLKESLYEKMVNVNNTLANFQTSLCRKRDRMLKKRNETISEIKHYYNRLRELLLSKLHRDEEALLNLMKEKVDTQDTVILEKIQQCCATTSSIQERRALLQNLEQLRSPSSSGNSTEYIRNLVNTSHFLKDSEQVEKDVAAVRDGFLVIRFFVNSDTEQTILNSNVASVEVLNSRSENLEEASLESERISEVAQAICNETEAALNEESIENTNDTGALRVALPPLNEQSLEIDNEPLSNSDDIPVCDVQREESSEQAEQESSCPLADQINELVNEFDTGLRNSSGNVDEDSTETALTNEMILSNIQIGTLPSTAAGCETGCDMSNERDCLTPSSDTEQINVTVVPENVTTHSETSEADRRQSVAITVSSDTTSRDQNIPQDDDPPPPYPGLTSSPAPPGPDELPPPYPGTGPPPPYSQNQIPEAQQPSDRRRLNGESGRRDRMPRHSSDSDVREIAAPTQTNTPRLTRPKVSKVFSVNEVNDRRVSGIYAVASVRGNSFLIVDRWNKKLKYFSDSGVSYGGLIFREEPWDITNMVDDLVAVTVPKLQTLYKIKVTDNSVITTSTVSTLRSYSSVAFNKVTQLFICGQVPQFGEPLVDIIGINGGQVIQTFRTGFNSEIRFSYPRYVKVNDEGMVIVCDWNLKCLVVFKLDGSVVGRYRGTVEFPLNEPTGVAYNPTMKEIYVIDAKHTSTLGAIHIVNLNCRCREIVRWDNEFRVARAITPHGTGYALGNKSGVLSIFAARQRR